MGMTLKFLLKFSIKKIKEHPVPDGSFIFFITN